MSIADKFVDFAIGVLILVLSLTPFVFINEIGNTIFPALLRGNSDGSTALGFGFLLTFATLILPVAIGIMTFLKTRQRKIIFKGFLSGLPILLVIWLIALSLKTIFYG